MRFSEYGQLPPCFLRSVNPAGGDLFQGSVDFSVKGAAFFLSPALFSVQGFQGAADHVLGIGKRAGGQSLLHQGLKIGGNVHLHA